MARSATTDPLRNFKFRVKIHPTGRLSELTDNGKDFEVGFSVVSGISVQNEMIAYREGGMNTHPHKMIGQSDYGPVTFTRGVFGEQDAMYKWQTFLHTWGQGGFEEGSNSDSEGNDYRCNISVSIYDHPVSTAQYDDDPSDNTPLTGLTAKMGYRLYNCWPASYAMGDLNAGDSSLLIQQLVVNHEGFEILWTPDLAEGSDVDVFG
jgi:phage tail-like protein